MVTKNVKRAATARERLKIRRKCLVGRQRDLTGQIQKVDHRIEALPSPRRGRPPIHSRRGPRPGMKRIAQDPLAVFVKKVMRPGERLAPRDVADRVRKAGYRTRQKNMIFFRATVGVALKRAPGIRKTGRGQFILRAAVTTAKSRSGGKGTRRKAAAVA